MRKPFLVLLHCVVIFSVDRPSGAGAVKEIGVHDVSGNSLVEDSEEAAALHRMLKAVIVEFQQNHIETSIDIMVSAWEAYPENARVRNNMRALSQKLAFKGMTDDACKLSRLLATDATDFVDLTLYAKIAPKCSDKAVRYATKLLDAFKAQRKRSNGGSSSLEDDDHIDASFMLGTLRGLRGDHQKSFEHYAEANQAARSRAAPSSVQGDIHEMNDTVREFSLTTLDRIARLRTGQSVKTSCPHTKSHHQVFILGFPRSGTSLVEQIVSSHSHVKALGEHSVLRSIGRAFEAAKQREGHASMADYLESLGAERLQQLACNAQLALLDDTDGPGVTHISSSTNLDAKVAWLIPVLYPEARVIWVRRCPLDTAWSNFVQRFKNVKLQYSFSLDDISRFYRSYETMIEHWRNTLTIPMMQIHYEVTSCHGVMTSLKTRRSA